MLGEKRMEESSTGGRATHLDIETPSRVGSYSKDPILVLITLVVKISLITLDTFLSGDTSHPLSDEIYAEMEWVGRLMKEAGYSPSTGSVFHDVEDDDKANMVPSFKERLPIAYGLISTPTPKD